MSEIPIPKDFMERVRMDSFLPSILLEALEEESPVSIRLNPKKIISDYTYNTAIPWCKHGFFLPERPSFTLDPLFHAGAYYPQEAGSMLLDWYLNHLVLPEAPIVLDLCAAPGGKSTLLASHLGGKGLLISNEVINSRARILRENMIKWGYPNTIVTNNDPRDFNRISGMVDLLVVDAPCSGEGMFRKDKNARKEWSLEHVEMCSSRQKRILMDAFDVLKPGGNIIYSTCTFNSQENEEVVSWFMQQTGCELVNIDLPNSFQSGRNGIGAYAFPGITKSEGFFSVVLQKQDASKRWKPSKQDPKFKKVKELSLLKDFVVLSGFVTYSWNEQLLAYPENFEAECLSIQKEMHIVKLGVDLGENSRKGFIPHPALALCPDLLVFKESIELDKQQALHYLHGDVFSLADTTTGFICVNYQSHTMGWLKNLGNRFNNLYPKDWRIRMNIDG